MLIKAQKIRSAKWLHLQVEQISTLSSSLTNNDKNGKLFLICFFFYFLFILIFYKKHDANIN